MREWIRLGASKSCGRCGQLIEKGAPVQIIRMPGYAWKMYRCEACALGPCPLELPVPSAFTSQQAIAQMESIGRLAVTFKRPEKGTLIAPPRKRVYRGQPMKQPGMLDHLPVRTRR